MIRLQTARPLTIPQHVRLMNLAERTIPHYLSVVCLGDYDVVTNGATPEEAHQVLALLNQARRERPGRKLTLAELWRIADAPILYSVVGGPANYAARLSQLDLRISADELVEWVTEAEAPEAWETARVALAARHDGSEPIAVAVTPRIEDGVQGVYFA